MNPQDENSSDDGLRAMFHDAVFDVESNPGTDSIRDRAAQHPSGRRWLPLSIACAAAMLLVIGGAFALTGNRGEDPGAASPGAPQASAAAPEQVTVPVYYVGDTAAGPRLFRETRTVLAGRAEVQASLDAALDLAPEDPDYRLALPDAPKAMATRSAGRLVIDFAQPPRTQLQPAEASLALQALVYSATDRDQGLPVQFLVAGQPVRELLGVDVSSPVARADAESTLATVSIAVPAQGQQVRSGFEVTGHAATFEANVVWELKQGDTVIKDGFTTAKECCTLAPYAFTVQAPPGRYTLVVHDTDESDGEGIGTSQDTKDITVVE